MSWVVDSQYKTELTLSTGTCDFSSLVPQFTGVEAQCIPGQQSLHPERLQWGNHLQVPDQVPLWAWEQGESMWYLCVHLCCPLTSALHNILRSAKFIDPIHWSVHVRRLNELYLRTPWKPSITTTQKQKRSEASLTWKAVWPAPQHILSSSAWRHAMRRWKKGL